MKRATVLSILVAVVMLAFAVIAEAQQPKKTPRIGYLSLGSVSSSLPRREAFREGLRNLGYVEGQNIIIEYGYAESNTGRLADLANDMVRLKLDVIVAGGTQ
jgi:putative tryptophan/tyrosine transport system substrate-binding protein